MRSVCWMCESTWAGSLGTEVTSYLVTFESPRLYHGAIASFDITEGTFLGTSHTDLDHHNIEGIHK